MHEYPIFVSRSFDRRDADIVDHVLDFCRSAGYQPIATDRASQSLPIDKVRAAIADARVFLGILTADHDGADSRRTRDWLPTEIGMADYARLPILLFIEEGVDYRPADHITSYSTFSRNDLPALWKRLVAALVELREDARVVWGSDTSSAERPYTLQSDDVEIEVQADGVIVYERHVEIVSNINELKAMRPQSKIITSSRHLGYFHTEFEFTNTSRDCDVVFEPIKDGPAEVSYRIRFPRPLGRGDHASFTVVHRSRGSLPLVREDVVTLTADDYITHQGVSRQGHAIKEPTERMSLSLKFPQGYPLADCEPSLQVTLRDSIGESRNSQAELERVSRNFRTRHNRLEVEVEAPKDDHAYYFVWKPPRTDEVPRGEGMRLGLDIA